jgi:ABC-type protease/lipase transport system fused ATPase/permease subunit
VKIPLYDSELTEYADKENCFQVTHSKSVVIVLQADNELIMHEWYDRCVAGMCVVSLVVCVVRVVRSNALLTVLSGQVQCDCEAKVCDRVGHQLHRHVTIVALTPSPPNVVFMCSQR